MILLSNHDTAQKVQAIKKKTKVHYQYFSDKERSITSRPIIFSTVDTWGLSVGYKSCIPETTDSVG